MPDIHLSARPKWLKVALVCLSGWLSFLCAFMLGAIGLAAGAKVVFRVDEMPGLYGIAALAVCLVVGIAAAGGVARWQHDFLERRTLKTSYIVFVILFILALSCVPMPFTHVFM